MLVTTKSIHTYSPKPTLLAAGEGRLQSSLEDRVICLESQSRHTSSQLGSVTALFHLPNLTTPQRAFPSTFLTFNFSRSTSLNVRTCIAHRAMSALNGPAKSPTSHAIHKPSRKERRREWTYIQRRVVREEVRRRAPAADAGAASGAERVCDAAGGKGVGCQWC